MDILAVVVLLIALVKKDKRCLPVCMIACLYSIIHSIFSIPKMITSAIYPVIRFINIPLLVVLLLASVITFRKPFENAKRYVLPIVFSGGALCTKILRRIMFALQVHRLAETGVDGWEMQRILGVLCTIFDVLYVVMFLGLLVSLIIVLNRKPNERNP